jgi:hypothetical protein
MNFISASKSKLESPKNKEEKLEVEVVKNRNDSLVEQCKDHDIQNKPIEIDTESPVKKKVESPVLNVFLFSLNFSSLNSFSV